MRTRLILLALFQTLLVGGAILAVRSERVPLGVVGEWEWLRVKVPTNPIAFATGLAVLFCYVGFVTWGAHSLRSPEPPRIRQAFWLALLFPAALGTQAYMQEAAPNGHGLAKWAFAPLNPGATGYYSVARFIIRDPHVFLAEYPTWIRTQGSLHIGTHPPGLFLEAYFALKAMERMPDLAKFVMQHAPTSADLAFQAWAEKRPVPRADRASMVLTSALTWLLCCMTVWPLYLLARRCLKPSSAWFVASSWPLVPAALMFQPTADTAFPFLTVCALLSTVLSVRWWAWSVACGMILALGMQFSLVFLPAGLIIALWIFTEPALTRASQLTRFVATGFGFLSLTFTFWWLMGANPFLIWWANQANHAHFYHDFQRSYFPWLMETPFEVAIALGLPMVIWIFAAARRPPREAMITAAVLALLLVTGRNLSEVARLWIPYYPLLLLMAGKGIENEEAGKWSTALSLLLLGLQSLALQRFIQVVYPV